MNDNKLEHIIASAKGLSLNQSEKEAMRVRIETFVSEHPARAESIPSPFTKYFVFRTYAPVLAVALILVTGGVWLRDTSGISSTSISSQGVQGNVAPAAATSMTAPSAPVPSASMPTFRTLKVAAPMTFSASRTMATSTSTSTASNATDTPDGSN